MIVVQKILLLSVFALLLPFDAMAAEDGAGLVGLGDSHINMATISQILTSLLFIIVIILLAAFLFRRYSGFSKATNKNLGVVTGFSIGSKERIVLIKAGDQQILVGVGPGVIQKIHVLDAPIIDANDEVSRKKVDKESFVSKLSTELKRLGV